MDGAGCTETAMYAIQTLHSRGGMVMTDDMIVIEDNGEENQMIHTPLLTLTPPLPLIRCVIEDAVEIEPPIPEIDPNMRIISKIKGRADDWFEYKGQKEGDVIKIHPIVFRGVFGQCSMISEYQVAQTRNGAHIRLVGGAGGETATNALESFSRTVPAVIEETLRKRGVRDPIVTTEVVEGLKRHPETHKVVRFIKYRG